MAALSASGTALTAQHRAQVSAWYSSPPVLCGDGDVAGPAARCRWVTEMTLEGREAFAPTLPDAFDPADWLATYGSGGLRSFAVMEDGSEVDSLHPAHAGKYLAAQLARQRSCSLTASSLPHEPVASRRGSPRECHANAMRLWRTRKAVAVGTSY
jgi:hypothetical protein